MEELINYCFSWIVSFQKRDTCEMLPLETKQSGDKLLPHSDLRVGGFLGEISSSRRYSKKDYREKKKEQHSYKIGTWNVRTLNRGDKLENFKNET
jgi:hypothetical protein